MAIQSCSIAKKPTTFKTGVSKLAKLSIAQGGLPPIKRRLPILAGEAAAKATDSSKVGERMLGADEAVLLLGDPPKKALATTMENVDVARPGVTCRICAQSRKKSGYAISVMERGCGSFGGERR